MNNERLAFADVCNKIKGIAPDAMVYVNRGFVTVALLNLVYPNSAIMQQHIDAICDVFKIGSKTTVETPTPVARTIRSSLFVKNDLTIDVM